jgi:hypothetical protein
LRDDALAKLKIREHPPSSLLVALLEQSPPKSDVQARKWFGILAGRVTGVFPAASTEACADLLPDFSAAQLTKLSKTPIVPIPDTGKGGQTRHMPPSQCYFGGDSGARFHSKLFVFVDFGKQANGFLSACGTKHEPSVEEIALILLADPHKFYDLANGRDK